MGADILRRAAALMRERAEAATRGPWVTAKEIDGVRAGKRTVVWGNGARVVTVGQTRAHHAEDEENAEHIASWHPAVALAVADWLDAAVEHYHGEQCAHADEVSRGKYPYWKPTLDQNALALARTYLGEDR